MTPTEIQLGLSVLTIIGAGIAVYVGVKVALAELRRDLAAQKDRITAISERITRLENPYFEGRSR